MKIKDYVAIALESIKKDGFVEQGSANNSLAEQYSPPSKISLPKLFEEINLKDGIFIGIKKFSYKKILFMLLLY